MLRKSVIAFPLIAAALTGCTLTLGADTGMGPAANEICRTWGESLSTRSHKDTITTQKEVVTGYADFAATCPQFKHLIPR